MIHLRSLVVAAVLTSASALAPAATYSGFYVFGDSLSDVGNVFLATNFETSANPTGNTFIPSRPYPYAAFPQFTNGNVWAQQFATATGLAGGGLPWLLPTPGTHTNYAFGGARTYDPAPTSPPTLTDQVNFLVGSVATLDANALYVVAGGGNDARYALMHPASIPTAASDYATAVGNIVDLLQARGAQHIIVWNTPDIGVTPAVKALDASLPGTSTFASGLAFGMNTALSVRLGTETGVDIFDVYGLVDNIVANPSAFNLTNVSDACGAVAGADCDAYLFWDGIHPTQAAHAILSQRMQVLAAVPEPASVAMLAAGLFVVGWSARRRLG